MLKTALTQRNMIMDAPSDGRVMSYEFGLIV